MKRLTLKVSTSFSKTPGARYEKEGDFSGEKFRKEYLLPKLKEAIQGNWILVVDLDGTAGYGTSFLEEAFGGLIREGIDIQHIRRFMEFVSIEDPSYIDEINEYISDAQKHEE